MNTAILVHGWEGYPEEGWRPWLRDELKKLGWKVLVPAMPNTKHPKPEQWIFHLEKIIKKSKGNIFLVGHSLGCPTILRFLENNKARGVVFVAGFSAPLPDNSCRETDPFVNKPFNFKKIKNNCPRFIAVHSDNDPWVSLDFGKLFERELGAKLIIVHAARHFSGDDGFTKLPVVLESLIEISK